VIKERLLLLLFCYYFCYYQVGPVLVLFTSYFILLVKVHMKNMLIHHKCNYHKAEIAYAVVFFHRIPQYWNGSLQLVLSACFIFGFFSFLYNFGVSLHIYNRSNE
jgi:hypothetical protein